MRKLSEFIELAQRFQIKKLKNNRVIKCCTIPVQTVTYYNYYLFIVANDAM